MATGGKRRLSSLREAPIRASLALLLVFVMAGAALLGASIVAVVAGFVSAALVIDCIFPSTGFLRFDAQHAFQRLVWQRRREALSTWPPWRRDHGHLELLSAELEGTTRRRHVGTHSIPLASIIGTVEPGKAVEFDALFRPPRWSRDRWELMWIACHRGDSLPPISVYRLDGRHFVIDGHHRVSVARALDAVSIDADVIELVPLRRNPGMPSRSPSSRSRLPLVRNEALALIDGRGPSPMSPNASERGAWASPGLLVLLSLAVGFGLTLLSGAFAPVPAYVLILAACILIGRGLGRPVRSVTGLEEYRQ